MWARCPAVAAKKVVDASKRAPDKDPFIVGWVRARVEALGARPLQWYRCLGAGHTKASCKSEVDRSGLCYHCGKLGHRAAVCSAELKCPYCADKDVKAGHRYGAPVACASLRPERRPKKKGGKGIDASSPQENVKEMEDAPPTLERSPVPGPSSGPVGGGQEEAMDTA